MDQKVFSIGKLLRGMAVVAALIIMAGLFSGCDDESESMSANEKRIWVMGNIYSGYEWDASFWIEEFGKFEQLVPNRYNPDIVKAFYFESIDMTLLVNILKSEIMTFYDGKEGH